MSGRASAGLVMPILAPPPASSTPPRPIATIALAREHPLRQAARLNASTSCGWSRRARGTGARIRFAGTGTTGEAAWREGMRAVLIEREAEYQADIRHRMGLLLGAQKNALARQSRSH